MRKSIIKTTNGQNVLNNPDTIGGDLDNFVTETRYNENKKMSSDETYWMYK